MMKVRLLHSTECDPRSTPCVAGRRSQTVTTIAERAPLTPSQIDVVTQTHLDDRATDEQIRYLESDTQAWAASLWRLLDAAESNLASARRGVRGGARAAVLNDLDEECFRIDTALTALVGEAPEDELVPVHEPEAPKAPEYVGTVQLQLSRSDGRIVAWAAGHNQRGETHEMVLERVKAHGGGAIEWDEQATLKVPGAGRVSTISAPLASALGWLVALGDTAADDTLGTSVAWMGQAAATAVELVAQGRVVPQLVQSKRRRKDPADPDHATFRLRWVPALLDPVRTDALIAAVPGAAMTGSREQDKRKFAIAAITDLTDAIVGVAAGQLEMPASPPDVKTKADVGEATLCHLDGSPFRAPTKFGGEVVRRLAQWAQSVVGAVDRRLVVQLDPPDEMGAWEEYRSPVGPARAAFP